MNSIRTRILVRVFMFVMIIWIGMTYATFYQSSKEVEELFDSELAQVAGVLSRISTTQKLLDANIESRLKKEIYGHRYEKKIAFQIWEQDRLLLHSYNAPVTVMTETVGYSNHVVNNEKWRIFKLSIPEHNQIIITAERYDIRDGLVSEITKNSLYPLTLMIPVLLFMIHVGVSRGLSPVLKIARQVSQRTQHNLENIEVGFNLPTEIKPLIEAINNLFGKLNHAFERERRITSDAAHELQTPLASIKAQAQVALRAQNIGEQQHALNQISQGITRATHLVQQLLVLARLDPQSNSYEMHRMDLTEVTRNILGELDKEAHKKHIELTLDAEEHCPITGNEAAVQIMVGNILSNAIRYSPDNSLVEVHITIVDNMIELCVSDNGPGISKQERKHAFERFYRGTDNQHIMGSGLGLSIVQRIAQLHQADTSMKNREDTHGLRFCIRFKAA